MRRRGTAGVHPKAVSDRIYLAVLHGSVCRAVLSGSVPSGGAVRLGLSGGAARLGLSGGAVRLGLSGGGARLGLSGGSEGSDPLRAASSWLLLNSAHTRVLTWRVLLTGRMPKLEVFERVRFVAVHPVRQPVTRIASNLSATPEAEPVAGMACDKGMVECSA
jgi:hypothetical protein